MMTKVAPNIWKTDTGWRVFVRTPDPETGRSKLTPKRFKDDGRPERDQLADLIDFRDSAKLEAKRLRRQTPRQVRRAPAVSTFADEAAQYLALETVQAMPSYKARQNEIATWVRRFGPRVRHTITGPEIDQQLQGLRNEGYSGSSVNKFRTALMALWTALDGRGAANPVKNTRLFEEAALTARGYSYDVLTRLLDAMSDTGKGRARLEVLAWTGMEPKQLKRMTEAHVSVAGQWYITPPREKGSRRRATPRAVIKKPMSPEAQAAFQRFIDQDAWGYFSTTALRRAWNAAQARVQASDPTWTVPHIRLKDLRHSFGTQLYEQTHNLGIVAQMLDHAPGSPMTQRYALGAVPSVLRAHMDQFRGRKVR